ncbi:glycosyl transferase family 2 [Acidaminococcus fermentans DSM 20731]|uniref:Glycosyl transferase family 2 n=2 Tax=Acidaminococcaceae TaxID=909930 RepID=D2RIS0_ACIFV|nr:glycosyl transferase family 2 [Acidaminococcus fermentans DSM 20731]
MVNNRAISFIIVTWNNEQEIRDCLSSIICLTPIPFQIIVVDNLSSDNTRDIIKKEFSQVKLIESSENLGFAKANNLGLKYVKSKYVCFINPDVILTEDIVLPSIKFLENDMSIGLVSCRLTNKDGSWQNSCLSFINSHSIIINILHLGKLLPKCLCRRFAPEYYKIQKDYYMPDWVIGAEMIMRTSDANAVHGFSEEYFMYTEDMDLCKKIQTFLNKRIVFNADVSLIHLGGASEVQNVNYIKQKKLFQNILIFCEKFYGLKEADKTLRNMQMCYYIRLLLLKSLYYKENRNYMIEHDKTILSFLKEVHENRILSR